uniref:DNA-directed RNA polymerases I, II, and III subunit RPABC1 n=1 Tax=Cryptomonas curvata TaxID=233186 RepID=A0A7S0M3M5_9CRYP|mmetsp:Transcript_23259/g.48690  ORF Transcript_23259/g.48690 Transcript_23259/m.48690 type:complete len:236 (+) Transcript_23259:71-778(+)
MDDQIFDFDGQTLNEDQIQELYMVRRTVCEMLVDRGYLLPSDSCAEEGLTLDQFKRYFHGKAHKDLTLLASRTNDDDVEQDILVCFPMAPISAKTTKIGSDQVKALHEEMQNKKVRRAIVVVEKGLLGHAQLTIDKMAEEKNKDSSAEPWRVEIFSAAELRFNITRHELVPRHTVLKEAEKRELLRRYHLQEKHLPRMQQSDPLARYFGLELRSVVKITRSSETAGHYVTYRLVG